MWPKSDLPSYLAGKPRQPALQRIGLTSKQHMPPAVQGCADFQKGHIPSYASSADQSHQEHSDSVIHQLSTPFEPIGKFTLCLKE